MNDVSEILTAVEQGVPHAAEQLLPLVYDELRKLAARNLAQERPGQTLQATALVHEAFVRLVAGEDGRSEGAYWDSRRHFFAAAAEAMRRILIDRARDKGRIKRGGGWRRLSLDRSLDLAVREPPDDLLALDEALQKLRREDPLCADLVQLRFFAGLTLAEAAGALGIPRRSADRYWAFARSWLYDELRQGEESEKT